MFSSFIGIYCFLMTSVKLSLAWPLVLLHACLLNTRATCAFVLTECTHSLNVAGEAVGVEANPQK